MIHAHAAGAARWRVLLGICCILLLAVAATRLFIQHRRGTTKTNIVFIVIDTLRADHCPDYGYPIDTMPNLRQLVQQSVLFKNVIAPSSWTKTSMASIMTARDPFRHGVRGVQDVVPHQLTTLAEGLSQNGYLTIGVNTNPWLKATFGFDAGFDEYETTAIQWPYVRAQEVNKIALNLLKKHSPKKPVFLYLHLMDVHAPCTPKPPYYNAEPFRIPGHDTVISDEKLDWLYRKEGLNAPGVRERAIELYDGEIRTVDAAIIDLIGSLKNFGLDKNTIYVIASDHGEEFHEHGGTEHGTTLYPEVIKVPLIFYGPTLVPGGVQIDAQVRCIDIGPTLFALAGLDAPESFEGVPLLPMEAGKIEDRTAICAVGLNDSIPDRDYIAVVTPKNLYIRERVNGLVEFYDLQTDPGALVDLGAFHPKATEIADLERNISMIDVTVEQAEMDETTINQLKALGYFK